MYSCGKGLICASLPAGSRRLAGTMTCLTFSYLIPAQTQTHMCLLPTNIICMSLQAEYRKLALDDLCWYHNLVSRAITGGFNSPNNPPAPSLWVSKLDNPAAQLQNLPVLGWQPNIKSYQSRACNKWSIYTGQVSHVSHAF